MKKEEVIKVIGEEHWPAFCEWMRGQTCSVYPDGETDYYDPDVGAFKIKLTTGYDRQADPWGFD